MRLDFFLCLVVITLSAGCVPELEPPTAPRPVAPPVYNLDYEFKDGVQANAQFDDGEFALSFHDVEGREVKLEDYRDKKNVVLIMTRGFNGQYCPYCTSQTSRLMKNAAKFQELETEVVVVFPGPSKIAGPFRETVLGRAELKQLPFPLVVDEDFAAVDKLKLRADLAAPSTFILDKQGKLRFAYVGKDNADRPSLKSIFEQLELIKAG